MTRTIQRPVALAISAALIGAGLMVAAPAFALGGMSLPPGVTVTNAGTLASPDYTVTIDCAVVPGNLSYDYDTQFDSVYLPVGADDVVTVETTNCFEGYPRVDNYDERRVSAQFTALDGPTAGTPQIRGIAWDDDSPFVALTGNDYAVGPNTRFEVQSGEDNYFVVAVPLAVEVADPLGTLVDEFDMVLASDATSGMVVADESEYFDDVEEELLLGGVAGCGIFPGNHYYEAVELTVTSAGRYAFRIAELSPASNAVDYSQPDRVLTDPFLAVYTSFVPASAHGGVIACNDDADLDEFSDYNLTSSGTMMSDRYSQLEVDLQPGTYTLVLTSYGDAARFEPGMAPAVDVATDKAMLTPAALGENEAASIEMWHDPAQLAATGPSPVSGGMLAVGLALMAFGGLAFASRRVWSRA